MTHTDLLPCPFCGGKAMLHPGIESETRDYDVVRCSSASCDAEQSGSVCPAISAITAWNTRASDTAPSQSADPIAEAENWPTRWNSGRVTPGTEVLIGGLVDALRATEAREKVLREALEAACDALSDAAAEHDECTYCVGAVVAARRALGGSND